MTTIQFEHAHTTNEINRYKCVHHIYDTMCLINYGIEKTKKKKHACFIVVLHDSR